MTDWPRSIPLRDGTELLIEPRPYGVATQLQQPSGPLDAPTKIVVSGNGVNVEGAVYAVLDGHRRREWVGEVVGYVRSTSWGAQLP